MGYYKTAYVAMSYKNNHIIFEVKMLKIKWKILLLHFFSFDHLMITIKCLKYLAVPIL
jgi:hypothetical protein